MGLRLSVESGWTESRGVPRQLDFDVDRVVIGRRAGCDLQLPHVAVSGHHATIRAGGAGVYSVIDEGSTNGVRIEGERIAPHRARRLKDGDRLEIGGFSIVVSFRAVGETARAEETAAVALELLRAQRGTSAALYIVNGERAGERIDIGAPPCVLVIGRSEAADIVLPDADASREHAELSASFDGVRLRDLESKNGVELNGEAVSQCRLAHGDEVRVGATLLRFEDESAAQLAALVVEKDEAFAGSELPVLPAESEAEPVEEPEPAPDEHEQAEDVDDEPAHESTPGDVELTNPAPRAQADIIVYALAGAVLALSLAGLLWLFR